MVSAVQEATATAEATITSCGRNEANLCIADALDRYASALAKVSPNLPPRLRALPSIVSEAAHRARVARTRPEAIRALKTAIATVNKTIALMRAEDPNELSLATKVGRSVDETFGVAEAKLLRSSEL